MPKFSPKSPFCETNKRNKFQLIILVYPFIFTGEEFCYDYGFPHAEWRQNLQAPGTKSNIDNIEAADSKIIISRKVDEPLITVTRKKKLETLFKQSGPKKTPIIQKNEVYQQHKEKEKNLKFQ